MQILVSLKFGILPAVLRTSLLQIVIERCFFLEKNGLLPENQNLLNFGGKWHNARRRPAIVNKIWRQIAQDADL